MARRIVIVGAGGFGRGVFSWLSQSPLHCEDQEIEEVVFVDDNISPALGGIDVVSTVDDYYPEESDRVLIAVGIPEQRREIMERLSGRAVKYHTFIDDRVVMASNTEVGEGTIICPGTVISDQVTIGRQVHINFSCSIGHDTVLGEFTTLSPMSNIMGETTVGSDVFIGGSAAILPRISIADGVTIGAGATVVRAVEKPSTLVGYPAKDLENARDPQCNRGEA